MTSELIIVILLREIAFVKTTLKERNVIVVWLIIMALSQAMDARLVIGKFFVIFLIKIIH